MQICSYDNHMVPRLVPRNKIGVIPKAIWSTLRSCLGFKADPFVIALATLGKPTPLIIVTEEGPFTGSAKKPNIPFICNNEGLTAQPLITVLRDTAFNFR